MRHSFIVLSSLLFLAAGCRHTSVPTLPASHGHLSLALDEYLDLRSGMPLPPGTITPEEVEVEVEPARARAVFTEAVRVLKGKLTEQEVRQAMRDLSGACKASLREACDFLRHQLKAPEMIESSPPEYPRKARDVLAFGMVIIRCRVGTDGGLRDCEVLESAPHGFTEFALETLRTARYRPGLLAGHPIEMPHTVSMFMKPPGMVITPEERLKWIRSRTERFPESTAAWFDLASMLAQQPREAPGYIPALERLNQLDPRYWWSASELAWMHVQAGRYAEAAPLLERARLTVSLNPYVLETSAATLLGRGQCAEAVAEQHLAVERLPKEWPAPERERFQRKLQEYTRQCPTATAQQPR